MNDCIHDYNNGACIIIIICYFMTIMISVCIIIISYSSLSAFTQYNSLAQYVLLVHTRLVQGGRLRETARSSARINAVYEARLALMFTQLLSSILHSSAGSTKGVE